MLRSTLFAAIAILALMPMRTAYTFTLSPATKSLIRLLAVASHEISLRALDQSLHCRVLRGMRRVGVVDDLDARATDLLTSGILVILRAVLALVGDGILRRRARPAAQSDVVAQVGPALISAAVGFWMFLMDGTQIVLTRPSAVWKELPFQESKP